LGDLLQGPGTTASMNNTMCLQASSVAFKIQDSLESSENNIDVNTLPLNNRERPESAALVHSNHTPIVTEDTLFRDRNNDGCCPSTQRAVVETKSYLQQFKEAVARDYLRQYRSS
jgi:hypothetical protein